jgi:hypothetical protein
VGAAGIQLATRNSSRSGGFALAGAHRLFLGERRKSAKGGHEVHLYEDLLHRYQHRLEDIDECGTDGSNPEKTSHGLTTNHLLLETIRRQRKELNLLQSNGRIGDNVHRNLERELDLKESLLT